MSSDFRAGTGGRQRTEFGNGGVFVGVAGDRDRVAGLDALAAAFDAALDKQTAGA
jgi:hypothetical protein